MSKNFESSLLELENIIKTLESSEVTLEESIALFEKGVGLADNCRKTLETAEQKILTLTKQDENNEN